MPEDYTALTKFGVEERLTADNVDLLGDQYDAQSGAVSFSHTDVSLPGNSSLEVAFRRRRSQGWNYGSGELGLVGDWAVDLPRVTITDLYNPYVQGATSLNETDYTDPPDSWTRSLCSTIRPGGKIIDFPDVEGRIEIGGGTILNDRDFSTDLDLHIPGQGKQKLLYNPDGQFWSTNDIRVTNGYWRVECENADWLGDRVDGFKATSPEGVSYYFAKLFYFEAGGAQEVTFTEQNNCAALGVCGYDYFLPRIVAVFAATRIEDVNGNWVQIDYSGSHPTRIHSNDGRDIQIIYGGPLGPVGAFGQHNAYISSRGSSLTKVIANDREWHYQYTTIGGRPYLSAVTLPDNRQWQMNLRELDLAPANCIRVDEAPAPTHSVTITHPNGMTGQFDFKEARIRGLGSPQFGGSQCFHNAQGYKEYTTVPFVSSMALVNKTLSGPAYSSASWTYTYNQFPRNSINFSTAPATTGWTEIIDPTGVKTRIDLHSEDGDLVGLTASEKIYATAASSVPIETTTYDYEVEEPIGETFVEQTTVSIPLTRPRHLKSIVVERSSDQHTIRNTFNINRSSAAYSFGNPTKIEVWSNLNSQTRITDTTYEQNSARWVLGLPKTVRRNGKLFDTFTYDSLGRLTRHDRFGSLYKTYGYHTDADNKGALRWTRDALDRVWGFFNYHRGLPQQINRPSGHLYRTVDDNGWVTSQTNARGHTTGYEYNNAGWLTRIDRPSPYNDTTLSYSLSNGVTLQTATRGPTRTTTYYDGFLRPYRVKTQPLSGGGQTTYVRTEYDALGRVTFTSLPSTAFTPTEGAATTYDALGRVTSVSENIFPYATTTTQYLSGNRIEVTDPAGHRTTTTYLAFGDPDNRDEPTRIAQPEGVTTDMTYDNYGNLLTARQYGNSGGYSGDQTQKWFYDSRLRVCSHVVAETGRTLYQYDAADQMTGLARGQGLADGCASLPSNVKVARSYDTLGRLTAVNFPSTTPDIAITYDANGNVTRNQRGVTDWRYTYDSADQLTEEKLLIDGRTYTAQYEYNASGHQTVYRSPSSRRFDFAPNGLGQPKQMHYIGTSAYYANNVAYHVNGQPKSFHYRNGQIYSMHLDARQLPQRIRSRKDGVAEAANFTYAYDANGRITIQQDWAVSGENRNYTYDGLGRLKTASGPWGAGSYSYDPLNNIRRKTLGSRTVDLTYTSRNRLATVRDTGGAGQTLSYVHDSRGNVIWDARGQGAYSYDWSEQPVTVSGAGASGNFVYDGNFKRVKQTINGKTIYSVYGQSGALLYRDNPHNSADRADYLRVAGMAIGRIEGSGASYREVFLHNDHLGSPVAATDGGGAVLWRESRTPFGEKLNDPADNRDDIGFTGHIEDADTGLTYMQARYYDPVVGRFHSNDPVGFAEGGIGYFNRYAYVGNDPINKLDPTGENSEEGHQRLADSCQSDPDACGAMAAGVATAAAVASPIPGDEVAVAAVVGARATQAARGARAARATRSNRSDSSSRSYDKDEVGSYTNTHESGKKYHGKGTRARSQQSGRREARNNDDPHTSTEFRGSRNDREAYKDESRRMDRDGGSRSDSNYNRRESPGRRYRDEDNDPD
ncbi:MAG: RHS repeat-associated core domain-containing protein [Pseudomonadota bacterium]